MKELIERALSAGSGEARLIRYESWDTNPRMPVRSTSCRNRSQVSRSIVGSRHWFGVLVKSWSAVAPIAAARRGSGVDSALGRDVRAEHLLGGDDMSGHSPFP